MTSGTPIHVQIFVTLRSDKEILLPYLQVVKGSRDLLLDFGISSLSREPLKLETSNLARRLATRGIT